MHFNPGKVSLMAFAILFKVLSAHCDEARKNHFYSFTILGIEMHDYLKRDAELPEAKALQMCTVA